MPRNGAGVFTVLTPIQIGALRSSAVVNADFEDMGDELTNTIPLDGQAGMTGPFLAASGTVASPGISFAEDLNTGFRLNGTDEMRWVAGAQDRAIMDANGLLTLLNGIDVTGSVNLSSVIGPQTLFANGQVVMTLRREENDTDEHELASYESGSGSGAKASLRVVGGGANDVSVLRYYVNETKIFEWSSSLFTVAGNLQVGGITGNSGGFLDFTEVSAAPSAPSTDTARLYSRDRDSGTTDLFYKDSTGAESQFGDFMDYQVFTASGTWTRPSKGTLALIEVWGGGGSGAKYNHTGSGTSSTDAGGGGGGGGAYSRALIRLADLSAAVSVTVGAGGAAQTVVQNTGNTGGNSGFGSYVQAFGGAGGGSEANSGGGGGYLSAGVKGNGSGGAQGGSPSNFSFGGTPNGQPQLGSVAWGDGGDKIAKVENNSNPFGGSAGTTSGLEVALFGGGGGGAGEQGGNNGSPGAFSMAGGAGGGGSTASGTPGAGGVSIQGGNGGAAAIGTATATDGSIPAGGGGGSRNGTSGAGARGEVRVTVW